MRHALVLVLGWSLLAAGAAAQQPPDFARVALQIERKLRDRLPAVCIDGLDDLRRYPQVKAVRLALLVARDPDAGVRQAALRTLIDFQTDAPVRSWMTKTVQREFSDDSAVLTVALLAGSDDAKELLPTLDKLFQKTPSRMIPLFAPAEDLGGCADLAAIRALTRLTELQAFATTRGLQRSVVKGLLGIRHRDAVRLLIEVLPRIEGEIRYQAVDHLRRATGQNLGAAPAGWQEWWTKNGETYRYPDRPLPLQPQREDDAPSYYGLPIRGARVVFIIDNSGSMAGPRIVHAKKELTQAIAKMPAETEFNIVVFNAKVWTYSPKPLPATEDAKRRAAAFVANLTAAGSTSTYDALETALALKPDVIFLLTDGEPTSGQIIRPPAIAAAIYQQNRLQSTAIHTIGIAPGPDISLFSQFLRALAEQNHGQFRKVE